MPNTTSPIQRVVSLAKNSGADSLNQCPRGNGTEAITGNPLLFQTLLAAQIEQINDERRIGDFSRPGDG